MEQHREISATLRAMEVGGTEMFPLSQYCSLKACIYSERMRKDGEAWRVRADIPARAAIVTRTR